MSEGQAPPIGGYFELEIPARRELPHAGLRYYQSARAAFLALLRAGRPTRIWMPRYICNAMLAPLENVGIEYAWYDLTDELEVGPGVRLANGEWLLYVNYFGVCGAKVDALLHRFSPAQIVLDYSQSFFSPPHGQALATIYSPRKFFGVPDGGLLYSQIPISSPDEVDVASFARTEHLIKRLGDSPEAGYAAYQRAEESLADLEPRTMSRLSERILASVDFESVRRIRKENFKLLHNRLGDDGGLLAEMDERDVPLCYPYQARDVGLRHRLISNRIFVATYWGDALDRLTPDRADRLVRNMFPLPIDQRYGVADMERISAIILDKA
ncbi:hypothetical protein [Ferrigenium sp. UT5]|uniref:hypothetical protein n=1 Tax=Ferrigenium sp. UT5 TaxID=3242105 RepID=UPI0038B36094